MRMEPASAICSAGRMLKPLTPWTPYSGVAIGAAAKQRQFGQFLLGVLGGYTLHTRLRERLCKASATARGLRACASSLPTRMPTQAACPLLCCLELCNPAESFIARLRLVSCLTVIRNMQFDSSSSKIAPSSVQVKYSRCTLWQLQTETGNATRAVAVAQPTRSLRRAYTNGAILLGKIQASER